MPPQSALPRIAAAAVASERATGVPAELTAAQTALESGWLNHCPGCNAFGVKARPGRDRQLLRTKEWFTDEQVKGFLAADPARTAELVQPEQHNGARRLYSVRDWFAKYDTLEDGLSDHARLISEGSPYVKAWTQYRASLDVEELVRAITPVYATDPGYGEKLLGIMRNPEMQTAIHQARG